MTIASFHFTLKTTFWKMTSGLGGPTTHALEWSTTRAFDCARRMPRMLPTAVVRAGASIFAIICARTLCVIRCDITRGYMGIWSG